VKAIPSRFCYTPKAYAYTKDSSGTVWNLTDYITAGEVQRLVNQASTASLTLRNPQKRFTTPSQGATFHPMDAITIFLERLEGFPVQVFTGYLDDTPYWQMYPGTITLNATCTLKKLLYMYFDPSLPYVANFLAKMGWLYGPTNGTLVNYSTLSQGTKSASNALQDAGIAKLLWAVLVDIGQWDDTNIWIEELPTGPNGIASRIAQLMSTLNTQTQAEATEFTTFMSTLIGADSQGSGGGAAGGAASGATGTGKVWKVIASAESDPPGASASCGPLPADGRGYSELSTDPTAPLSSLDFAALGKIACSTQLIITNPANGKSVTTGKVDVGAGSTFNGSPSGYPVMGLYPQTRADLGLGSNPYTVTIQRTDGQDLNPVRGTLVSQNANATSASTTTGNNPRGVAISGATASTASASGSSGLTNPIPGFTIGRDDMGVDASAPVGSPIYAVASSTLVQVLGDWFEGEPLLLFKFDTTPPGAPSDYWYIAEQIVPVTTTIGTHVNGGDPVAHFAASGTGIEIGWGSPTSDQRTLAGVTDPAAANPPAGSTTPWGESFKKFFAIGGGTLGTTSSVPGGTGAAAGSGDTSGGAAGGGGTGMNFSNAEAFTSEIAFPSVQEMATAMILGNAHKGLMNDQQLMPFIQELTQASLRSFQSLPNGDFFAFYPDYFGETDHRPPYWDIQDIEILDGGINLSDQSLVTHYFAVGDNTYPLNDALVNALFSTGEITVFNAFLDNGAFIDTSTGTTLGSGKGGRDIETKTDNNSIADGNGMSDIMSKDEAVAFVQRYGARPQVTQYPMVRSPIYEMFLAYQGFLLAWSNQFQTPFSFTFMPEIFPGGKVAFPQHGIQMYVQSVTHEWDYAEGGFTTSAQLTAPARIANSSNPDLPPNMVQALVEPVRSGKGAATGSVSAKNPVNATQQAINKTVQKVDKVIPSTLGKIHVF
jgi:hypothetical protein